MEQLSKAGGDKREGGEEDEGSLSEDVTPITPIPPISIAPTSIAPMVPIPPMVPITPIPPMAPMVPMAPIAEDALQQVVRAAVQQALASYLAAPPSISAPPSAPPSVYVPPSAPPSVHVPPASGSAGHLDKLSLLSSRLDMLENFLSQQQQEGATISRGAAEEERVDQALADLADAVGDRLLSVEQRLSVLEESVRGGEKERGRGDEKMVALGAQVAATASRLAELEAAVEVEHEFSLKLLDILLNQQQEQQQTGGGGVRVGGAAVSDAGKRKSKAMTTRV